MNIKEVEKGRIIVYLSGRIDVSLANNIEEKLMEIIKSNSADSILLDFSSVEYMSSSGFRVAISILRAMKDRGGIIKLCSIQDEVQKVFDLIELAPLFEIYSTEKEALESF